MKLYMILSKITCSPIRNTSRLTVAVKENEVSHSDQGGVMITDILEKMGYTLEGTFGGEMYAVLPKSGPMAKETRYNIDELKLIDIDSETGVIA